MDIRQQSLEGLQNEVMPAANEMNVFSPSSFLAMNEYEDIMAFLCDDNDNSQQEHARKKSKTLPTTPEEEDSLAYLFQLDHPLSLEDILGQDQTPQSLITNTTSTIQLNPNSSERINISVSTGIIVPNSCSSTFCESSSSGLVQQLGADNMAVMNSIFSSENCSSSSLSLPAGSNAFYAPESGTSFGDSIFPKTTGYSYTQFESPSFPVQPYASASGFVGNYETQLQSPSLVHPYAGPSVGTGSGANNLDGNSPTPFHSPSLVHPYAAPSAAPSNLHENLLTQFQSPNLVHPYAGPSVGSGVGANNLDGNSLTQFQSPGLVHPYAGSSAGPSVDSGSGANNFDGNSLTQFQSPSLVHPYAGSSAGPSVGSGVGANNLDGNSVTQYQLPGLVHPYAGSSAAPSVGSGSGATNLDGNSLTQFQSPSLVHPYAGAANANVNVTVTANANINVTANANDVNATANANASTYGSHQQFSREHRLEINPATSSAPSAMGAGPQYQTQLLSRQPFLRNFNDFELAWEGCLVEETYPYRPFFIRAKAWKKSISPISLTEWPTTMKVAVYVPRKAVINTMRLYGGPIDYIFFEVTEFGNLDLYTRLMTEKKYAKIVLPSHTLILFTTESKHCYLGSVFKGDTIIVEHL